MIIMFNFRTLYHHIQLVLQKKPIDKRMGEKRLSLGGIPSLSQRKHKNTGTTGLKNEQNTQSG